MSELSSQWLLVHSASVLCQNTALDIENAGFEGDTVDRDRRVAAFQAIQDAQMADLDSKITALQVLLLAS